MFKSILSSLIAISMLLPSFSVQAESAEPWIDMEEAQELDLYGLRDEEIEAQSADAEIWVRNLVESSQMDAKFQEIAGEAGLVIKISQARQRMTVYLNGKEVPGMVDVRISTGANTKGKRTPNGSFRVPKKPDMAKKRLSKFATRVYGKGKRKIYLEYAVQISGGAFLHAASQSAQKNTLGERVSNGCVRVDRAIMPKLYALIAQNLGNTVFIVQ